MQWLGAVRQQAIAWTIAWTNGDVDPFRHMTSLDLNELMKTEQWYW